MLNAEAKTADPIVKAIEERMAALVGIPVHCDEDDINIVFRPETADAELHTNSPAVVNVHLDARLGRPYSAATVLVYLNSIEPDLGGGTVFPCVGQNAEVKDAFIEA